MTCSMKLAGYSSLVFDCDGVVLNSNKIKTEAFHAAALPWGKEAADALVDYHVAHGGVSRYAKFEHFLSELVPIFAPGFHGPGIDEMLLAFANSVRRGLAECEVAVGLKELREITPNSSWFIVSGGDQAELRDVFEDRGLANYFDGGIFGSPDTKQAILGREISSHAIKLPALFIGDSRLDHTVSAEFGLDFVFLTAWTELKEWNSYVNQYNLATASSLKDIITKF